MYALDCEMCYTTGGMELTRVSLISHRLETVYDTFVLPDNAVLDYNTKYASLTSA